MPLTKRDKKDMVIIGLCLLLLSCFLYVSPVYSDTCIVVNGASQTLSTNQNLKFDTDYYDPVNMHSTITNIDRITIQNEGNYTVSFTCQNYDPGANANMQLVKNGSYIISMDYNRDATPYYVYQGTTILHLVPGDYITVRMSTASSIVFLGDYVLPRFSITSQENIAGGSSEMTETQYLNLFAIIAFIAICVGIMCGKQIWHFIGGDG